MMTMIIMCTCHVMTMTSADKVAPYLLLKVTMYSTRPIKQNKHNCPIKQTTTICSNRISYILMLVTVSNSNCFWAYHSPTVALAIDLCSSKYHVIAAHSLQQQYSTVEYSKSTCFVEPFHRLSRPHSLIVNQCPKPMHELTIWSAARSNTFQS